MRNAQRQAQRKKRRRGHLINVWVAPAQKDKLNQVAKKTHVNQSEIIRQALEILFDQFDHGQLTLGFPENKTAGMVG